METKYTVSCPNCSSEEIQYDEMVEEHIDVSTIFQTWEGKCMECGKRLQWTEEYRLHNVETPIVVE